MKMQKNVDLTILMCLVYVYLYIHIWLDFWVKKLPEMFCRFIYRCFQIGSPENFRSPTIANEQILEV